MDMATCVGSDSRPKPGDFTVCIRCGHIMIFGDDLRLRELTRDQMHAIAGDERLLAIQRARAKIKK